MPEYPVLEQDFWSDLQPLLDQELSRLPDKYRVAIVLCDLQGKTRREVAQQLALPPGTVAGRLTRGREMLAKSDCRGVGLDTVVWPAGGSGVAECGNSGCAGRNRVKYDSRRQPVGGGDGGDDRRSFGHGRRDTGRSAEDHVVDQTKDCHGPGIYRRLC